MRIGVFGGAFNPPHIGHVEAARRAYTGQRLDLLIVIPTGTSPHKPMPPETPPPDIRLKMTQNAFTDEAWNIQISDAEVFSTENNYTIDTLRPITEKYKGSEFFLLVGNDMYDSLGTWKESGKLLETVKPVLLPRDIIDISSTQVRQLLKQREGKEYLCDGNYELIIKHRLYGAKPDWEWLRGRAYAMLEPKRIAHTQGCEQEAMRLAEFWGESIDEAREAAILHDITKKLDFNENLCIIAKNDMATDIYNKQEEKLLHSITAAIIAKKEYGVSDAVANAIRLHTTGAAAMTMLDKIIYLADYIEPGRDFDGIEKLREEAYSNIDKAMITGLTMTVNDLKSRGISVNLSTYEAINDLSGGTAWK